MYIPPQNFLQVIHASLFWSFFLFHSDVSSVASQPLLKAILFSPMACWLRLLWIVVPQDFDTFIFPNPNYWRTIRGIHKRKCCLNYSMFLCTTNSYCLCPDWNHTPQLATYHTVVMLGPFCLHTTLHFPQRKNSQ